MRQIGGVFGRSAMGPLHEQIIKVLEPVGKLDELFEAACNGDKDRIRKVAAQIDTLEHQADEIKDEIRANLSRSFFTSVQREDILVLIKLLDGIADRCQDLGKFAAVRPTPLPHFMHEQMKDLLGAVTRSVASLSAAIAAIRKSEDEGTLLSRKSSIEEMLRRVAEDEFHADQVEREALAVLFEHEVEMDPVTTILLMRFIEKTGWVADQAENAADGFRRLF